MERERKRRGGLRVEFLGGRSEKGEGKRGGKERRSKERGGEEGKVIDDEKREGKKK